MEQYLFHYYYEQLITNIIHNRTSCSLYVGIAQKVFQEHTNAEIDSLNPMMSQQQELEEFNTENQQGGLIQNNENQDPEVKQNGDEISVDEMKQTGNQGQIEREREEPPIDSLDEHQQMAEILNQAEIKVGIQEKPIEIDGFPSVPLQKNENNNIEVLPLQEEKRINQIEDRKEQSKLTHEDEIQFNELNIMHIHREQLDLIQNQEKEIIVQQIKPPIVQESNQFQNKYNFEDAKFHFLRQDDRINQVLEAMKMMQIEMRNLHQKQKVKRVTKQKDANLEQYLPQKKICLKIDDSNQNSQDLPNQFEQEVEQESSNRKEQSNIKMLINNLQTHCVLKNKMK